MGDLNEVQQEALSYYIAESDKQESDKEWMRFKLAAVAANNPNSKAILELSDKTEEDLARPLTDEEIENYRPLSAEEVSETLKLFEDFGLRMD